MTVRPSVTSKRVAGACAGAVLMLASCREQAPVVVVHGADGPVRVQVELALTQEQQARGLMWRDRLDPASGMLFVFPAAEERSFWMRNTPLPLDIIFIGPDRRVVSVAEKTTPHSTKSIPSGEPAQYVLEVNAGFARTHGIARGALVELP